MILLLNLRGNVSVNFSMQNEMAYFLNSWWVLLKRFVTSNVIINKSGSISGNIDFKKWMPSFI